ncbi:MAG: hypothetical protein IPL25_08775 [Saprospiraceae bacterium]|nr:hypothetical protein [Candidatus Vicinibacter affinis]
METKWDSLNQLKLKWTIDTLMALNCDDNNCSKKQLDLVMLLSEELNLFLFNLDVIPMKILLNMMRTLSSMIVAEILLNM